MKIYTLLKGALTGFFFKNNRSYVYLQFFSPNHSIKA